MLKKLQNIFTTPYSPSLKHQLNITKHQTQIKNILKNHPTPLYITDPQIIQNHYTQLKKALSKHWPHRHTIAYSFKTNYQLIEPVKKLGAQAEVVSHFEYKKALKHNFKASKIILNGPHKPKSLLKLALTNKSLIHIDNTQELNNLLDIQTSHHNPKIGIRINLNPQKNHFGFNLQNKQAHQAIKKLHSHSTPIQSLHLHQGSDIDKPSTYQKGALQLAKLANHIYQNFQTKIKYIDVGGGFPAHSHKPLHRNSWQPQPIQAYIKTITQALKQNLNSNLSPTLIVEPGRYLVADSTTFICKIIAKKSTSPKQTLICNGAITMLPTIYYRPPLTQLFTPKLQAKTSSPIPSTVYGSTCKSDDILLKKPLPPTKPNDLLIFYSTGAYNSNLTPNFIFPNPKHHLLL